MDDGPGPRGVARRLAAAARRHALPLAALLLLAALPFVAAALRGQAPFFLDIQDHWMPFRIHAWNARQQGEMAQWCRHVFCGVPFLGQVDAGLLYPPHFLTDLVHPCLTLLPTIVGHRFLLGAGMYAALLAAGSSRRAALLAGALLIACGFTTVAVQQPAHLRALAWIPCFLGGAWMICRGRRLGGLLWLAGGGAMAILAGYPAIPMRAAFVVPFVLFLDPAAAPRAREWIARWGTALAAGALCLALCAAQVAAAAHMTAISQRALGLDPAFLDAFRAAPGDFLMMLLPRPDADGGVVRAGFGYLGTVPLALALLAVIRRRPGAAALAATAGVSLLLCLGGNTPVGAFLQGLPGFSFFRNPSQFLVLWCLVVCALAAMGLDAWIAARPTRRELAICLAPLLLLLGAAFLVPRVSTEPAILLRLAATGAAVAGLVAAWALDRRLALATALLLVLPVADAASHGFTYATKPGRTRAIGRLADPEPSFARIAAFHAAKGGSQPARIVTSNSTFNWDDRPIAAGLENVRGLFSLTPLRVLDVGRILERGEPFARRPTPDPLYDYGPMKALGSPLLDLMALRYAAGFADAPAAGWRRIGPQEWERDAVAPARLVPHPIVVAPGAEAWREFLRPSFSPVTQCVVESPAPLPSFDGAAGEVVFDRTGANSVEMTVTAPAAATLLWTETWDDGWSASIDGAAASSPLRANHAFMALAVPAGAHRVTWRYETPGLPTAGAISLAGLAAFAALSAWALRRTR